jgi:hypothetical protein
MTIKNAALLALIGTALIAALLTWTFVSTLLNVVAGVAAPLLLFSSLIYAFGGISLAVFFCVFHKHQS